MAVTGMAAFFREVCPMDILAVEPGSLAESAGIRAGDVLERINGQPVEDVLDYMFWGHEEALDVVVRRDGVRRHVRLDNPEQEGLGLSLEELEVRRCRSRCIFCFVDQLPQGLRASLYVKDEDYRLSFLHGSYVTLTDLTAGDVERIGRYGLSPLYVSVHASDPVLRGRMLGREGPSDVLGQMGRLAEAGIRMHGQIVLCPGINDGAQLGRTLGELSRLAAHVRSVAVVPVGLTRFREDLAALEPVTCEEARRLATGWAARQAGYQETLGTRWAYLADEFYLLGGVPIPEADAYEDFPQMENGVGMTRAFLDAFAQGWRTLPKALGSPRRVVLVTGTLAAGVVGEMAARLREIRGLEAEVLVVENGLLGERVTVSGLLAGADIARALSAHAAACLPDTCVILPPNCVNDEGRFLDNLTLAQVQGMFPGRVTVGTYDLVETLREVLG